MSKLITTQIREAEERLRLAFLAKPLLFLSGLLKKGE